MYLFKSIFFAKTLLGTIILLIVHKSVFAQFPCGSQQLSDCNCRQTGTLIADSDPCTFNSGEGQTHLLVDVENAIIGTDPDDGVIVNTSSSGVFNNVEQGDYVMYSLEYDISDEPVIRALTGYLNPIAAIQSLGTEAPPGTWTSSSPSFTLTASPLATVNGPECGCRPYSCGNFFWLDWNSNGIPDPGEPGIPFIIIWLFLDFNGDGIPDLDPTSGNRSMAEPIATAVSNESGYYHFYDIPAGRYVMQIDLSSLPTTAPDGTPTTYIPTFKGVGSEFRDSDFDSQGFSSSFTLDDNETNSNFDAGFRVKLVTLSTELLTFSGQVTENGNELVWATANEVNNDYFNVLSSSNGVDFESIGAIDGKGNSTARQNYNFLDNSASTGATYYRLTTTDFSGRTTSASKTIVLTRKLTNFELTNIHPIPAVNIVNVEFTSNKSKQVEITVFNSAGQTIVKQMRQTNEGVNQLQLNIEDYPIGVYMVVISDGKDQLINKFIKN